MVVGKNNDIFPGWVFLGDLPRKKSVKHLKQIQVLFVPEIALHKAPLAPHETALAKASTPRRSRASCGPNNKGARSPRKKSRKRPGFS